MSSISSFSLLHLFRLIHLFRLFHLLRLFRVSRLFRFPFVCKLAPGGLVGWSWRGIQRDAVLCDGTIGQQGVVESLLRLRVLILELGEGTVLSDHLPGMLCQIHLRIGDGLQYLLLHEILVNQVLEPAALSLYGMDAHHAIAVVQQIGIEIVVEELVRCYVGGALWIS